MTPESERIKRVRELVSQNPGFPLRALARKLFEENPKDFKNMENARSVVRYAVGSFGNKNRLEIFSAPPSTAMDEWKPFIIPSVWNRTLVLSDTHCPQYDIEAVAIALDKAKDRKVDSVYFNGDMVDMYMLSRFIKDPRMDSVNKELECVRQLIRYISHRLKAPIIWYFANHERRMNTYILDRCPGLAGVVNLVDLIDMEDEVSIISEDCLVKYGKLTMIHGDEMGRGTSCPVSPARTIFLKLGIHTLGAHYHKSSFYAYKRGDDEGVSCWTTGCLQVLHPVYSRINQWNHGFAILEKNKGGEFQVENYRIERGGAFLA